MFRLSPAVVFVVLWGPAPQPLAGDGSTDGKDKPFLGRPLPDVLAELHARDPKVRLGAVKALAHVPTKEAVPGLRTALADPEPAIAELAARGLHQIGPDASAAVPDLVKRLREPPSEAFREAAISALGGIGPRARAAVPLLLEQFQRKEASVRTRQAILWAVGQIGPGARAAVPTL